MITTAAPARETTVHAARRRLAALLPSDASTHPSAPLELQPRGVQDAPALRPADVIEPGGMRARPVGPGASPRFRGFLDGAQWSRVVAWTSGVPIVHGTIAAVVRQRQDRRLTTWSAPIVRRAWYVPMELLPPAARDALRDDDLEVVDTLATRKPDSAHPFALQEIAYQTVLAARESAERELAHDWCAATTEPLFVDGALGGSEILARSPHVTGVVKSQQTLYGSAEDLQIVLALRAGERSSVLRVAPANRSPVASWYLRLRDHAGRDPFWGLARVEIAQPARDRDLSARADEVSGWVLAEALPLSAPDARWDKMVYGIRDCEEYLRGIQ